MKDQPTRRQTEEAAARAYAAAYPAPWEFVFQHIELVISAAPAPEVRLLVFQPADPPTVGEVHIMVSATDTGRRSKGELFYSSPDSPTNLPVDRVGCLIAEAIAARPGSVDLAKIPKWAKAATAEALTPHRERIKAAQATLRGAAAPTKAGDRS